MPYTPVKIDGFGGLDASDPTTASGAIDLYNVLPGRDGEIRTRSGLSYSVSPWSGPTAVKYMFGGYAGASATSLVGFTSDTPECQISSGGSLYTDANSFYSVATFGTTSATYLLMARDSTTMRQFDGATFASITYSGTDPKAKWVAIQPGENRVVIAGPQLGGGHRVYFSDAGDYTTYGTSNYVGLTPGDGEQISGVVAYESYVLVFKRSKIFVFYGNSTDASGNPVFNYRVINGIGAVYGTYPSYVAAQDGVYFWHEPSGGVTSVAGLYKTNGNSVERVTRSMDNVFSSNASSSDKMLYPPYLTYPNLAYQTTGAVSFVDDCIWVPVKSGSQHLTLAVHTKTGQGYLLKWDTATTDRVYSALGASGTIAYVGAGGALPRLYSGAYTQDQKTNVASLTDYASLHRTGYTDLGAPGTEKIIRETILTGSGSPSVQISSDYRALDTAASVTLGTSPLPAQGRRRVASRGTVFSTAISSSAGQWSVGQIIHNVRNSRRAGIKAT